MAIAAIWQANASKLTSVGLQLNASKLESLLETNVLALLPLFVQASKSVWLHVLELLQRWLAVCMHLMGMINLLQMSYPNLRIVRAKSGFAATMY